MFKLRILGESPFVNMSTRGIVNLSTPGIPRPTQIKRVVAYVDGFNLYFGLRDSKMRRYLWLNLPRLVTALLVRDQILLKTKYFTSLISAPAAKRKRQTTYLEALRTCSMDSLEVFYGKYQTQDYTCRTCSAVEPIPSEKKTDVNIAVEMMVDAFGDSFDTAILVTADSDLVPPITSIKRLFPEKRIVIAFPPGRFSQELRGEAHTSFTIGRGKFAASQLPESVTKHDGTVLVRPDKWKADD